MHKFDRALDLFTEAYQYTIRVQDTRPGVSPIKFETFSKFHLFCFVFLFCYVFNLMEDVLHELFDQLAYYQKVNWTIVGKF